MNIQLFQRNIEYPLPDMKSSAGKNPEWDFLSKNIPSSDTFIFPEYFAFHNKLSSREDFFLESGKAVQWLWELSLRFPETVIIGGSLIDKDNNGNYKNASHVYHNGNLLLRYEKRRLYGKETGILSEGSQDGFFIHPRNQSVWGVLICADVFIPDIFSYYEKADFIAIPTSSPFREDDTSEEREKRDREIFQNGSKISGAVLFKSCSVGSVGKNALDGSPPPRLQGRSLIAGADAVLCRAPSIHWEGILEFRSGQNTDCRLRDFYR